MAVWNTKVMAEKLHGWATTVSIEFPKGSDLAEWSEFIQENAFRQPIDFAMVVFTTVCGVERRIAAFWFPNEWLAYIDQEWVNTRSIEDALIETVRCYAECDAVQQKIEKGV